MKQLLHALCNRKPFPKHLAISTTISTSPRLASLLRIVSSVPPLLEAVDSAMTWTPGETETSLLFGKLFLLESGLNAWLRAHIQQQNQNPATKTLSQKISPPSDRHTQTTILNLTCESLCRIGLLLTTESLANLSRHNQHHPQPYSLSNPTAPIPTTSPESSAASLCQITILLTNAAQCPLRRARIASGPLHFLQDFFARRGDSDGLKWCAELKGKVYGAQDGGAPPVLRWDALFPWCLLDFHRWLDGF